MYARFGGVRDDDEEDEEGEEEEEGHGEEGKDPVEVFLGKVDWGNVPKPEGWDEDAVEE